MSDQSEKSAAQLARDRAIAQTVDTLVYIGLMFAISAAIVKRDAVTRLYMRLRHRPVPPAEQHARYMAAELARDISRIEHDDGPRPRGGPGLYERP
jgi:hypothetical protein